MIAARRWDLQAKAVTGRRGNESLTATRWNSTIKTFYQRLLAKRKPKKVPLTAAMRKLLTIINALVKSNQLWRVTTQCPAK